MLKIAAQQKAYSVPPVPQNFLALDNYEAMTPTASCDIESLMSWAQNNQSTLHPSVEIYHDNTTGFSFRAKKPIVSETKLVDCSYSTTLSWLNAIGAGGSFSRRCHDAFPRKFLDALSEDNPNVIGHFFLVQQYLLKEKSFWWHYIKLLPQPDHLFIPILWPEDDRDFLNGTNAEPAIQKYRQLWYVQWAQGYNLLDGWDDRQSQYTFQLYQWAAAIFGSRSFRPSLTITPEVFEAEQPPIGNLDLVRNHILGDYFSVLFPLLDIGNHNGINNVKWSYVNSSLSLLNLKEVSAGCQVHNYYGNKSNSELLVAYGFMLPETTQDRVNIKLIPPPRVQGLRRSQASHSPPPKSQPEQEFMFYIGKNNEQQISHLSYLSRGLFDTTLCMVANEREFDWMSNNPDYSGEKDPKVFHGVLGRSAFQSIKIINAKIELEIERLDSTTPGKATNPNQVQALDYRQRQMNILTAALSNITSYASSCSPLTLPKAFEWLRIYYPTLSGLVEAAVAEDQEEELPVNWQILVPDWDHAYLILFVYILLALSANDPSELSGKSPSLLQWIEEVQIGGDETLFHGGRDEKVTIDFAIAAGFEGQANPERRNLASWIVKREVVRAIPDVEMPEQDMLCIPIS